MARSPSSLSRPFLRIASFWARVVRLSGRIGLRPDGQRVFRAGAIFANTCAVCSAHSDLWHLKLQQTLDFVRLQRLGEGFAPDFEAFEILRV